MAMYAIAFLGCLSSGLTPGKALLSIRVVDKRTGAPAGFGRMFVREIIGKFVSGFFLGLGFFWAIWDRDAQAWHDKLANTIVVRTEAEITQNQPSAAWPAVAFLCLACSFLFLLLPDHAEPGNVADPAIEQPSAQISSATPQQPPTDSTSSSETTSTQPAASASDEGNAGSLVDASISSAAPSNPSADADASISQFLNRWTTAAEHNDAADLASYYEENVARYFLARNVSRSFVQNDKQQWLDSGHRFVSYKVGDITVESASPSLLTLSLTKNVEWSNNDAASISRETHSRLWLTKDEGDWHIVGEQDLLK
jgi:RDD family